MAEDKEKVEVNETKPVENPEQLEIQISFS